VTPETLLWFKLILSVAFGQTDIVPMTPRIVSSHGQVSLYYAWKKSATVPNASYAGAWLRKPTPADLVCAHRTLPFGTILRIRRRSGQRSVCIVLDRGPFGACVPSAGARTRGCKAGYTYRVIVRDKMPAGGYYRGEIDATPAVHKLMGSSGSIWARIERVGVARSRRALRLID
jgi:hypothetical protein